MSGVGVTYSDVDCNGLPILITVSSGVGQMPTSGPDVILSVCNWGSGNDRMLGETGNDSWNGCGGNDALNGGGGTDNCDGAAGRGDSVISCEVESSIP